MQPQQACSLRQLEQCLWPKQHLQMSALNAAAGVGSSDDDGNDQSTSPSGQRLLTPWISRSSQPPPDDGVPTTLQSACHQAPSPPPSLMLRERSLASAQSTARCGFALTTLLLAIARRTGTGWTLGAQRAGTPLSLLTFTQIGNQLPNSRISRLVVLLDLPFVRISATGVRLTSSRSYPGILDLHEDLIRAYWLRTSMGCGM